MKGRINLSMHGALMPSTVQLASGSVVSCLREAPYHCFSKSATRPETKPSPIYEEGTIDVCGVLVAPYVGVPLSFAVGAHILCSLRALRAWADAPVLSRTPDYQARAQQKQPIYCRLSSACIALVYCQDNLVMIVNILHMM